MSANVEVLQGSGVMEPSIQERAALRVEVARQTSDWNPEDFAREQIRSLVRRVFFASGAPPVRQIVMSATEPHTDLRSICDQVGGALALETHAEVAIVGQDIRAVEVGLAHARRCTPKVPIKSWATRTANNLWHVPEFWLRERGEEPGTRRYWISRLAELRSEFEYSLIHGTSAGTSSEAALLGQLTDGIILVLDAHSTRRATARKIKEALESAQSRILGTVLIGRTFPVPERIYRRL
jgi:hypothetical protein